jgi:hypothetical protein
MQMLVLGDRMMDVRPRLDDFRMAQEIGDMVNHVRTFRDLAQVN